MIKGWLLLDGDSFFLGGELDLSIFLGGDLVGDLFILEEEFSFLFFKFLADGCSAAGVVKIGPRRREVKSSIRNIEISEGK